MTKGYGGGRAKKLARSVAEDASGTKGPPRDSSWPSSPPKMPPLLASDQDGPKTVVRRWSDANAKGKPYTDYLLTTLTDLSASEIAALYDSRGAMEVDIRGDKRGLGIEKRRKKSFHVQEALALLAQLAHNLLAWFQGLVFGGDRGFQAGGGEAGQGGDGDAGPGEDGKEGRAAFEAALASPVGQSAGERYRSTLPPG